MDGTTEPYNGENFVNKSIADRIILARRAGRVRRFHTCDLIKPQTDGEHTFNILNILCILFDGDISDRFLKKALFHDMGELRAGDMPGNIKRMLPDPDWIAIHELRGVHEIHPYDRGELDDWEEAVLKLADNLDGLLTCTQELRMGNLSVWEAGNNYYSYVGNDVIECAGVLSEMAQQAIKILLHDWVEASNGYSRG